MLKDQRFVWKHVSFKQLFCVCVWASYLNITWRCYWQHNGNRISSSFGMQKKPGLLKTQKNISKTDLPKVESAVSAVTSTCFFEGAKVNTRCPESTASWVRHQTVPPPLLGKSLDPETAAKWMDRMGLDWIGLSRYTVNPLKKVFEWLSFFMANWVFRCGKAWL